MGASPGEAFEQAALALIAVMSDPASVQPRESVTIVCEAPDLELLLVE
jgi:SHS2 domain-containing protein